MASIACDGFVYDAKIGMTGRIHSFDIPEHVEFTMNDADSDESILVPISDISASDLELLCDMFKADVFKIAGKPLENGRVVARVSPMLDNLLLWCVNKENDLKAKALFERANGVSIARQWVETIIGQIRTEEISK